MVFDALLKTKASEINFLNFNLSNAKLLIAILASVANPFLQEGSAIHEPVSAVPFSKFNLCNPEPPIIFFFRF